MKKLLTFILLIELFIAGCKPPKVNIFYDILNENFLAMVDTTAYHTGRLIQIPNETIPIQEVNKKLTILVDTNFVESLEYAKKYFLPFIKDGDLSSFSDLISDESLLKEDQIKLEKIKNVGRYRLQSANSLDGDKQQHLGIVSISRPFMDGKRALLFFSIASSPKSGKTIAYFFKRTNGRWQIVGNLEVERW